MRKEDWKKIIRGILFSSYVNCLICHRRSKDKLSSFELCSQCLTQLHFLKEPLCKRCGRELNPLMRKTCGDCEARRFSYLKQNRSAVSYTPLVKDWIYKYKYQGRERLVRGLGELLYLAYSRYYSSISFAAITYVPLHPNRLHERKFNQAEQLAHDLAKRTRLDALPMLERLLDTPKQSRRTRGERIEGLKEAFIYRKSPALQRLSKGPILLIDDIYTTGATLHECAKELMKHGWREVYGLTVTRA